MGVVIQTRWLRQSRGVLRVEVMARRWPSARGERLEQTELGKSWRER